MVLALLGLSAAVQSRIGLPRNANVNPYRTYVLIFYVEGQLGNVIGSQLAGADEHCVENGM